MSNNKEQTTNAPETETPVVKVPVVKDAKNGITRPTAGTKTGRIWEIADAASQELKAPAGRKAVIAVAVAEEINPSTAATQYGRWRKYNGLVGTGTEPKAEGGTGTEPKAEGGESAPVVE